MLYSYEDTLKLERRGPREDRAIARLRGAAWLGNALRVSGLEPGQFAREYIHRGRSESGLLKKWLHGDVHPTRQSAEQVERSLPGTLWVFESDMWTLLSDSHIRPTAVEHIIEALSSGGYWSFPIVEGAIPVKNEVLCLVEDTQRLVYRGDLWGFVGALALTRLYESSGRFVQHCIASQDMFRALPGALKEPWLRPLCGDLLRQLGKLKSRVPYASMMYDIDEDVIVRQADDPEFEPFRDWRRRDPKTYRFLEIEDPILPAILVPGRLVASMVDPVGAISSLCQSA